MKLTLISLYDYLVMHRAKLNGYYVTSSHRKGRDVIKQTGPSVLVISTTASKKTKQQKSHCVESRHQY